MKIINTLLFSLLAGSISAQVGIGTTSPDVALDIEAAGAAIDINNTSTDPLIHFQVSGTTNFTIGTDVTDNKFKIGTIALETGTAITVQPTGEVGIGTSSPGAELDVNGNMYLSAPSTEGRSIDLGLGRSGNGNSFIDFIGDATYTDYGLRILRSNTGANSLSKFVHRGTGELFFDALESADITFRTLSIERFSIAGAGDVTINESNAAVDFRVEGDTEANLLFVDGSADAVGIGTSSPSSDHLLTMKSSRATTGEVTGIKMINANSIDLEIGVTGASYTAVGQPNAGLINVIDAQPLIFATNNTERMRIRESGFVGIGTTSPSVELEVTGDIEYTGTITDVSDRRLKENFSSIDSVLTKIMKIEGLSYNMINDTTKRREYGVIAQDVQAVFPEMVSIVDPENGYLGVAYIQLVPILLEATKKQQAIIDAQNKEIENLKQETSSASTDNAKKFAALEAKLNALLLNQNVTLSAKK